MKPFRDGRGLLRLADGKQQSQINDAQTVLVSPHDSVFSFYEDYSCLSAAGRSFSCCRVSWHWISDSRAWAPSPPPSHRTAGSSPATRRCPLHQDGPALPTCSDRHRVRGGYLRAQSVRQTSQVCI